MKRFLASLEMTGGAYTGIKEGHADLNVVARTNCSSQKKKDKKCVDGSGDDGYGHGTHVVGIAAASDNDIDVVGVAPGAPLYSVKVLDDSGNGTTETVIKGLDWVAARSSQIRVANLSIGGACIENDQIVECDDANPCTVDICYPTTGTCVYPSVNCEDGDPCTQDWCDQQSGCVHEYICECGTNGAACSDNSDCCSNKCKRGTCRGN